MQTEHAKLVWYYIYTAVLEKFQIQQFPFEWNRFFDKTFIFEKK